MNGDKALLLAKTIKNPNNSKTIITGISQYFFLFSM